MGGHTAPFLPTLTVNLANLQVILQVVLQVFLETVAWRLSYSSPWMTMGLSPIRNCTACNPVMAPGSIPLAACQPLAPYPCYPKFVHPPHRRTPTARKRLAVPFRAAHVPSERAEYAQPDTALTLTALSYYYDGLSRCGGSPSLSSSPSQLIKDAE